MLIVSGVFEVDPERRDEFLQGRVDAMKKSRLEAGCLEYVLSADPVIEGRVVLLEKWESQEHLDAHIAAMPKRPSTPDPNAVKMLSSEITIHDVAGTRSF